MCARVLKCVCVCVCVCVRERERERERERGRVGYNEAAGKKFVITGVTDITNSGYNESLLNVPGDSL